MQPLLVGWSWIRVFGRMNHDHCLTSGLHRSRSMDMQFTDPAFEFEAPQWMHFDENLSPLTIR